MPTIRRMTLVGVPDKNARPRESSIQSSVSESRRPSDIFTQGWQEFGEDSIAPDYIPEGEPRPLARSRTMTLLGGRLKLRPKEDNDDTDWWFASTAIPLIVATFAPMANMMSIAALVVYWRNIVTTPDVQATKYSLSVGRQDPPWALNLNGASLACGFVGNAFLLCNFTRKIRYIIALPVSILFFYIASSILIAITVAMHVYDPPRAGEVYSQGYWYAVLAACLYMFCGMLQMVNMLGYFLGHYPQHFDLNDEQRNLILQTMIFFLWLGGGAGVFATVETDPRWGYPDALYFCDVTLLTIGFGDFYATNDVGRGLVFPFSVGGTIILGLMVSSIHKFAGELSKDKVIRKHIETKRVDTLSRAATMQHEPSRLTMPVVVRDDGDLQARLEKAMDQSTTSEAPPKPLTRTTTLTRVATFLLPTKSQKAILMYSERDRFNKMREIQHAAKSFKKWYALTMSIISFSLLWCVGAMVFYFVEHETQDLSYFQALYFCYVSLLTIGYGDLSPKSNAGKPFFVLWSLIAVPMMTVLISDLGDTAISSFKRKVLDYGGLAFLGKGQGWGVDWFLKKKASMARRLSVVGISLDATPHLEGGRRSHDREPGVVPKTIDQLLEEDLSRPEMLKRLAYALRNVASDLKNSHRKRYTYEEWVEFTRLIRFSKFDGTGRDDNGRRLQYDEVVDGIVEWDWLDSNSPMISQQSEAEWVMDRLLESLLRTFKRADVTEQFARRMSHSIGSEPRLSQSRLSRSSLPPVFDEVVEYGDLEEQSDGNEQARRAGADVSTKHKRRPKHLKAPIRTHGVRFHKHHNVRHKAPPSPESSSGKESAKASRDSSSSQDSVQVVEKS